MPTRTIPHPCRSILPIASLVLCALLIPIAVVAECPTTTLFLRGTDPGNVVVFDVSDELSDPSGSNHLRRDVGVVRPHRGAANRRRPGV